MKRMLELIPSPQRRRDPKDEMPSDRELVELSQNLYSYFRGAGVSAESAKDWAQETLMRLVSHIKAGRWDPSKGTFRMYAFGIARLVRFEARRVRGSDREMDLHGDPKDYDTRSFDGREEIEVGSQRTRLMAGIETLRPEEREVVLLSIDRDLTLDEIAALLDIPVGTVKSHVHRAKVKLKTFLTEQEIR
jgi:RNA polymerase sigma factor (sigma-70 family)